MTEFLKVATDGSGRSRGNVKSSWAFISETGFYKTGSLYNKDCNYAELKAVEEALRIPKNLLIICDSSYVIQVLCNPKAKKNKENIKLINLIEKIMKNRQWRNLETEFVWQKGHTVKKKNLSVYPFNAILNHFADNLCTSMREFSNPKKDIVKKGTQLKLKQRYIKISQTTIMKKEKMLING